MRNSRGRQIPLNRPVVGSDLRRLQEILEMSTIEACNLFGVTAVKYGRVSNLHGDEPVEPVLALIARLVDNYLDDFAKPKTTPEQVIREMAARYGLKLRECSLMLGRDQSAASRWKQGRAALSSMRLAELLEMTVLEDDNISEWEGLVRIEGMMQTGDDVFKTGRWKGQRRQRTRDEDDDEGDE